MRPGQHNKRGRNRHRSSGGGGSSNTSGSGGGNPLSRVYESNGPDVKVRGTAQTVADKYLQLGRDAHSAGDSVMAESYYQYAEHYLRIVAAAQAYQQQMQPQSYRRPGEDDDEGDDAPETASVEPRHQPQPSEQPDMAGEQPFDGERPQQQYQHNNRPARDTRDQSGQSFGNRDREQGGQQGYNRDRSRSRWQDRSNPQPTSGDTRPPVPQQRADEAPRDMPQPVVSAPVIAAADDNGQWEAPSFLRRPAPLPPAVDADEPAPVAEAAAPRRTRKPRSVAANPAVTTPEPAAD